MTTKTPPDFRAYTAIKREGQKDFWVDVGAAFLHQDGAGMNVVLQAMPLDGRIILRPFINEGRKEAAAEPNRELAMQFFAVGDIHGCLDKLIELFDQCRRFARRRPTKFIFLGDYIDRGPDSREVVQFLIDLQARHPDDVICLCGNHEDLLHHLDDPRHVASWLANGGDTTLRSYGVRSPDKLPADHLKWLLGLPTSFDDGQRLFVHAGIRPGLPLDQQTRRDLLWIREPFLSSTVDHGRLIVHGHSPTDGNLPDIKPNRINLDTGAVFGGPLTAAVFIEGERSPVRILKTR